MPDPCYRITGGNRLSGSVEVSGAKNAALPCMAAALLTDEPVLLERVPDIADVASLAEILAALGAGVERDPAAGTVRITAKSVAAGPVADQLAGKLRASVLVAGPLLARHGEARCRPGGDEIGERPLRIHAYGFARLGAEAEAGAEDGNAPQHLAARAARRLQGAPILLDYPTVSGTENIIMAAVLAQGRTEIINAATEPEVADLAALLNAMGARISGAGTQTIVIDGVARLRGARHRLIPDRIEAGTLAIAAAITAGDVLLRNVVPAHLLALRAKLAEMGVALDSEDPAPGGPGRLRIRAGGPLRKADIQAVPYPGFPTDLQAPMTALLTRAAGESRVQERVFERRLSHAGQLRELGADIARADNGNALKITGPARLRGADVAGADIRAAAALVLAALAAEGTTQVRGVADMERGYDDLPRKLTALGADITRLPPAR